MHKNANERQKCPFVNQASFALSLSLNALDYELVWRRGGFGGAIIRFSSMARFPSLPLNVEVARNCAVTTYPSGCHVILLQIKDPGKRRAGGER